MYTVEIKTVEFETLRHVFHTKAEAVADFDLYKDNNEVYTIKLLSLPKTRRIPVVIRSQKS